MIKNYIKTNQRNAFTATRLSWAPQQPTNVMRTTKPLGMQEGIGNVMAENIKVGKEEVTRERSGRKQNNQKTNILQGTSAWPVKKHQKGPNDRLPIWRKGIYCCVIRMTLKKNNVSVNLTNLKGQTIIKFTSGLIQKKKSKSKLRSIIKWIIEKSSFSVKNNFDRAKVIIKGHSGKSSSYSKESKRKKLKIIYPESRIPVVHNGCRPPKKRRV